MHVPPDVATPANHRASNGLHAPDDAGTPPDAAEPNAPDDANDVTRLSGRVRFARTLAKLSKAELARRVGVCLSAAVQWELPHGTSPTVTNLAKIAAISGVAFEWIATGRGSPKLSEALQEVASAADLDYEVRLLEAARAVAHDRREVIVDFVRSMAAR
jgi:transcriptional regulator with XRE-family HTH domain